jgi:hypothetical protein
LRGEGKGGGDSGDFSQLQGDKEGFPGDSWQFSGFSTLFFIRLNSYEISRHNGEGISVRK